MVDLLHSRRPDFSEMTSAPPGSSTPVAEWDHGSRPVLVALMYFVVLVGLAVVLTRFGPAYWIVPSYAAAVAGLMILVSAWRTYSAVGRDWIYTRRFVGRGVVSAVDRLRSVDLRRRNGTMLLVLEDVDGNKHVFNVRALRGVAFAAQLADVLLSDARVHDREAAALLGEWRSARQERPKG